MAPFLSAGPFSARDGEGRVLFTDVTVALDEGELVVLDGPSGSGKSTLLRQLVAMLPTADASRELGGELFASGPQLPRWRSMVTLIAQDAPMLDGSLGDNVRFPFTQRCSGKTSPDGSRLSELMRATGLAGLPEDRDVSTLSGGERHRLALVRGLLWDPPVLVADEPFSGLDDERAAAGFDLLREFAHRSGHCVLCVLHDRSLATRADRILPLATRTSEVGA